MALVNKAFNWNVSVKCCCSTFKDLLPQSSSSAAACQQNVAARQFLLQFFRQRRRFFAASVVGPLNTQIMTEHQIEIDLNRCLCVHSLLQLVDVSLQTILYSRGIIPEPFQNMGRNDSQKVQEFLVLYQKVCHAWSSNGRFYSILILGRWSTQVGLSILQPRCSRRSVGGLRKHSLCTFGYFSDRRTALPIAWRHGFAAGRQITQQINLFNFLWNAVTKVCSQNWISLSNLPSF